MRYWTVPYVAIEQSFLGVAYYTGIVAVLVWFFVSVGTEKTFLEYDDISGLSRPRLRIEKGSKLEEPTSLPQYCSMAKNVGCTVWDADEVSEAQVDEVFVSTLVKTKWEQTSCQYEGCRVGFEKVNVSNSYLVGVEDFHLLVNANFQAFAFYDECQANCSVYSGRTEGLSGRLMGNDRTVLAESPPGTRDEFPLSLWLAAAGVSLDDRSDASSARKPGKDSLRWSGACFWITYTYTNKDRYTLWDSLFTDDPLPLSYEISVQHQANTDFKKREVLKHVREDDGAQLRQLQLTHGLLFRIDQSGQFGRFAYSALLHELVLKMGLIAILTSVLDFTWQFVMPLFGVDYNDAIFDKVIAADQLDETKAHGD